MEMIKFAIFAAFSGVILLSALGVVFSRTIVYAVLSLFVCFLSVAGIFFSLNADFVGASQIILYGVGTAILLTFAIMLLSKTEDKELWLSFSPRSVFAFFAVGALFLFFVFCFTHGFKSFDVNLGFKINEITVKAVNTPSKIASELFSTYVLAFEVLSLILLSVIVGAAVIAKKDEEN